MATVYPTGVPTKATINRWQIGMNTPAYDSQTGEPSGTELVAAMGTGATRYPGGSLSDGFNWHSSSSYKNGAWQVEYTTLQQWIAVAQTAGVKPLFTGNYGSNVAYNAVNTALDFAELAQFIAVNNYPIDGIEIGNEVYAPAPYGWETNLNPDTEKTPAIYGTNATAMAQAVKASLPDMKIGVPVLYYGSTGLDGQDNVITAEAWASAVLTPAAPYLDYAIVHDYISGPGFNTPVTLDVMLQALGAQIPSVVPQTASMVASAAGKTLPIWVTETNNTNTDPVSASNGQALYITESILLWLSNGVERVYWFELCCQTSTLSPTSEIDNYAIGLGTDGVALLSSDGTGGLFPAGQVAQYLCSTILGDQGAECQIWMDTLTNSGVFIARLMSLPSIGNQCYWIVCNNLPSTQTIQVGSFVETLAGYTITIYLETLGLNPTLASELTFTHTPYTIAATPVAIPDAYITSVAVDTATNTITINGENFGSTMPTLTTAGGGGDTSNFAVLTDVTNGNYNYAGPTNYAGLTFTSWSATQVVLAIPSGVQIPAAGDIMNVYLRNSGGADQSSYIPEPCPIPPVGYAFPWTTGTY